MEIEKVKEIKKVLKMFAIDNKEMILFQSPVPQGESCVKSIKYADILTYINELENENERFKKDCADIANHYQEMGKFYFEETEKTNQLKDRIAELEKENARLNKLFTYDKPVRDRCFEFIKDIKQKAYKETVKELLTAQLKDCIEAEKRVLKIRKSKDDLYYNGFSLAITNLKMYIKEVARKFDVEITND